MGSIGKAPPAGGVVITGRADADNTPRIITGRAYADTIPRIIAGRADYGANCTANFLR